MASKKESEKSFQKTMIIYHKILSMIEEEELTFVEEMAILEMLSALLATTSIYNKNFNESKNIENLIDDTMHRIRKAVKLNYGISPTD